MATIAISALPVATAAAVGDVLPIVQGGTTKQVTNALLFTNATMVAPALGTVASGNISACTSTSMVMVTPVLGTVTSGNISACTSTSMVMVTPVLGTVTSGNISACTSTSMALTTPVIGAATGTSLSTTGNQVITGTGKQGYAVGAGGGVLQATSKATAVVLNKSCGQITMNAAALGASTTVTFTMTNSTVESGDIIVINHISGGTLGSYTFNASCGVGTADINVRNVSLGSLSDAVILRFAVIKVVDT